MQGKMIILYTDGTRTEKIYTGRTPELEDMQEAVDGYIEHVATYMAFENQKCVVFANEEGLLRNMPVNPLIGANRLRGNVVVLVGDKEFMDAL